MATIDWSNKSATVSTVTFALENVPVGLEISLGDAVLDPAYFWKAPLTVRATEPCSPMSGFFDVLCEVTSSDGDIGYLRIEVPVRLECPPGQELIVFSNRPPSGAPESDSEIWKMDLGTGAATRLTGDHQQIEDLDPAWSPDRSEIVFVSNRADPSSFAFDLVLMDLDGNDQKALTDLGPQNQSADDPAWSPAAGQRRIAFTIGQTAVGSKDIWILDLDEPESSPDRLRQITTGGNNDTSPTWSPDGQKIAFIRNGA
ncbi:MAG: hypothetical protein L6Q95_06445, partial [Planctomycetes bacterium]|nr:hypothetical protein [Planctomycetota bacterium]